MKRKMAAAGGGSRRQSPHLRAIRVGLCAVLMATPYLAPSCLAAPADDPPAAKVPAADPPHSKPMGPPSPGDIPPPYEPQLLRLAELLGALAYLQDLCGAHQGDVWRAKMAALLDVEAKTPVRKERLAGAFNRGFKGYALTYRACTPNAQTIIGRFLDESGKIAHDVARQYGPS